MERRQDNRDTHRSFNEVLNSTIQRGQDLLSRNFINYDYVESERKDIYAPTSSSQRLTSRSRSPPRSGQKYNYVASSGYGLSASKRVDGAGRTVDSRREYQDDTSPLKDYISRKIDTHLDRLRGPPAKESRTITETPFDHRTDVRGEPIQFESQVHESDHAELARRKLSEERRKELNDEHFNPQRHASSHHHTHQDHSYDEIHDSRANQDQGDLRENVEFQVSENRAQNHKHVRLADSTIDVTNHTYLKHRQMVDRITASHHDSPARESKLFDQTEHPVQHGAELSNTFRNTGSNWPEEGHPQEDQWTKTSRSIDRLEKRQQEIEHSRKYRGGHAAEEEIERELFEKSLQDGRKVANNLRFGTSYYGETSQSRVHDTLRLRALEDMSPAQVGANETSVIVQDNAYLVNLYHSLKQRAPRLERQTLKFAATRINPPRCLLDVLDALFSLVYGVYPKVGHDYFANQDRKYFEYKVFFQTMDELVDTIKHLKLYLETQGLPIRNIIAADKAICRYQKTVKRIEAKPYIDTTEEISKFVLYYLEYYNVLRKLNLEPLSKTDAERGVTTSSPQLLKNHTHQLWHENVYQAPANTETFSQEDLVGLLQTSVKRKTWAILKALETPGHSVLHSLKALHALLGPLITEPLITKKREWEYFRGLLGRTLPTLAEQLPDLVREGRLYDENVRAAEALIQDFREVVMRKKELNDSFLMQYATKIINLVHYACQLHNLRRSAQ